MCGNLPNAEVILDKSERATKKQYEKEPISKVILKAVLDTVELGKYSVKVTLPHEGHRCPIYELVKRRLNTLGYKTYFEWDTGAGQVEGSVTIDWSGDE